uniref:Uncharacterized protein n=1 Tax=Pseudomonas phage RVTF4 TaxID=3236931 RepID=A0AB39CCI6_9VIRU
MTPLPEPHNDVNLFNDTLEAALVGAFLYEIDTFSRQAEQARYYVFANEADGTSFSYNIGNYTDASPVFIRLKASLEGRGYANVRMEGTQVVFKATRKPVEEVAPE